MFICVCPRVHLRMCVHHYVRACAFVRLFVCAYSYVAIAASRSLRAAPHVMDYCVAAVALPSRFPAREISRLVFTIKVQSSIAIATYIISLFAGRTHIQENVWTHGSSSTTGYTRGGIAICCG